MASKMKNIIEFANEHPRLYWMIMLICFAICNTITFILPAPYDIIGVIVVFVLAIFTLVVRGYE